MKKSILVLLLILSCVTFGEVVVPKNVERDIRKSMSTMFDSGSGDARKDYYKMQMDSYITLEETLANSTLTLGEKDAVRRRLKGMYGVNYERQLTEVKNEILIVSLVNRETRRNQEQAKLNETSKEDLKTIVQENKEVVSKKYMEHIQAEATRLYPENIYEQKRYIESSINTYKLFFKETK